jgi:hypothetical protein
MAGNVVDNLTQSATPEEVVRTLSTSLDEAGGDKSEIISRVKAMPNSTRNKRRHCAAEPRFFASRGDAQVDVIPEPFIGILVPGFQVLFIILCCFEGEGGDVCYAVPSQRTVGEVAVECEAREHAGAF